MRLSSVRTLRSRYIRFTSSGTPPIGRKSLNRSGGPVSIIPSFPPHLSTSLIRHFSNPFPLLNLLPYQKHPQPHRIPLPPLGKDPYDETLTYTCRPTSYHSKAPIAKFR